MRKLVADVEGALFQEQMMQIAIDCAGVCARDADELRQAVGSKRAKEHMEALRGRLESELTGRVTTLSTPGLPHLAADAWWFRRARLWMSVPGGAIGWSW